MLTASRDPRSRPAQAGVIYSVVLAGCFEAVTLLATQDHAVREQSPWAEDPYDAMVSLAEVAVPVLAILITCRLLTPRRGLDRDQQLLRAALAMVFVIDLTLVMEWSSVIVGAPRPHWNSPTTGLVTALIVLTAGASVATAWLIRVGALTRLGRPWEDDWLDDGVFLLRRVPVVSRFDLDAGARLVRVHAVAFFLAASASGACLVIGALAHGERWTDPWLIGWALFVETSSNFALCMLGNMFAGFVARSAPAHPRLELSVVAGCLGALASTAFRDPLWKLLTGHELDSVAELWALTGVAALMVGTLTYLALVTGASLHRNAPKAAR